MSSGLKIGFCGKKETPDSLLKIAVPLSGARTPAIQFNNVDFPLPFRPIRAAFSPRFSPKVTSVNRGASLPIFVRFLTDKRFMDNSF